MTETQYKNIQIFAEDPKWRGYKAMEPPIPIDQFKKTMQMERVVRMLYVDRQGKEVVIFFTAKGHNISNAQSIRQLIGKFHRPIHVIFITEQPLNNFGKKALQAYRHLKFERLLHENFSLIVPYGPLCHKHRIMSKEEVDQLLNNGLYVRLINLPKILKSDVQCIWLGAQLGDVIEIEMISDICGPSLHYRVVVQKSGRVAIRESTQQPATDVEDDRDAEDDIEPVDTEQDVEPVDTDTE